MLSKALIFNAVLLFFGFVLHATASPLAETSLQTRTLGKRYEGTPSGKLGDGGPDTSDYQSDSDIAAAYVAPNGAFVFFSGIKDSQAPYQFSQTLSPPGSILRGAFTKGFVTRGKPQRSQQWFQDFWTARPGILLTRLLRLVILFISWGNSMARSMIAVFGRGLNYRHFLRGHQDYACRLYEFR